MYKKRKKEQTGTETKKKKPNIRTSGTAAQLLKKRGILGPGLYEDR